MRHDIIKYSILKWGFISSISNIYKEIIIVYILEYQIKLYENQNIY